MKKFVLFFLFSCSSFFGASVFLVNDSPFTLTAEIISATGLRLGKQTLKPGQNLNSELDSTQLNLPQDSNTSQTPYSVTWTCESGNLYSYCPSVLPGGLVQASQCNGSLYCEPKKKSKEG